MPAWCSSGLTGIELPRATLDREARRLGQRAQALRQSLDQQAATAPAAPPTQLELTLEPYQMIIQLDARNLRERDASGRSALVIADGAVWIWRLADDRWPQARQRLDSYHAASRLAAVGRALHGEDKAKLRAWLQPLVAQLKNQSALKVIGQLEEALGSLPRRSAKAKVVSAELDYLRAHQARMDYRQGVRCGEPIGSGAIESTCRQLQCRFKRPGQFWSRTGDEALLSLDTFWRNGRWHLLFPHAPHFDPSKS
jgi:Rad3-related DNA helicase